MWDADSIVATLRARGELWESSPGVVGLRGDALALARKLDALIAQVAAATDTTTCEEWWVPSTVALSTLARASYFESFPQWLTLAGHLRDDGDVLERVARSDDPASAARAACGPADAALPPAVCYHVYAALADRTVIAPVFVTAQGTCWRHEGTRLRALVRGWAFTMREGVCVGDATDVGAFRDRGAARAIALAESLGLSPGLEEATDPFFAPTSRGRKLLQQIKGLKQELVLPVGSEQIAAASFNLHDTFFGEGFDIRLSNGAPAHTACVAYGVERWTLAFLAAHGPDARHWPALPVEQLEEIGA